MGSDDKQQGDKKVRVGGERNKEIEKERDIARARGI